MAFNMALTECMDSLVFRLLAVSIMSRQIGQIFFSHARSLPLSIWSQRDPCAQQCKREIHLGAWTIRLQRNIWR